MFRPPRSACLAHDAARGRHHPARRDRRLAICFAAGRPSEPPAARPSSGAVPARSKAVTFDPFGDFATEGYLRNFEKEKNLAIIKRAEHASFVMGLDEAFASHSPSPRYSPTKTCSKFTGILFGAIYPWAGEDRTRTAPTRSPEKSKILFEGHLDAYLQSLMRDPVSHERLATAVVQAPGLDGSMQARSSERGYG